jgi:hypothetical protein
MKKETRTYNSGQTRRSKLKKQLEFDRDTQEAVWSALEALTAPELETRQQGFDSLLEQDVVRKSPLVVYVLATRLLEPEIQLRWRIVRCLADLVSPAPGAPPAAGVVLTYLHSYLAQMRKRPIFALLQVAGFDPESSEQVGTLLKACSFAGNQLSQIIADHAAPIPIRRLAITFTSQIGFLVAIPTLERMVRRIEARAFSGELLKLSPFEIEDNRPASL